MIEFVLFCRPTIVSLVVQSRGQDRTFGAAMNRAGASLGAPSNYRWAMLLLLPLVLTGWLAIALVRADVLEMPGASIARVTSVGVIAGIVLRAVGEEVLFRGLLGGIFVRRRYGFPWGNLLQTVVFLVPHLALLLIDGRMWPILPVQVAAGRLLGWLRKKSDTFLTGAAVHVVANVAASLITR